MRRLLRYFSTALILGLMVILIVVAPVLAATVGNPSPSSGTVGSSVTISGNGALNDVISIRFGSASLEVDNQVVDSTLTWSSSFTVPTRPAGNNSVFVYVNGSLFSTKTFKIIPKITLSSSSGASGTAITITGNGFAANDGSIQLSFDSGTSQYLTTTDTNGSFAAVSFSIPAVAAGSHTITVTDSSANPAPAPFTTVSNAAISLSKTSGAAGSSITVNGSGFVGGSTPESSIVVTYDGTQVGSSTSANSAGTWSLTFNIPASAGGSHNIGASGATTLASQVAVKTFSVTAGLSLSKASGPPGAQTTITGTGFAANETGINITWDNSPLGNPVNAGPTGAWTSTITIPSTSAGVHNINTYGTSTTSGGANLAFNVGAGITTSKTSGTAGTTVSVSGAGFAASEKSIAITFDTATVASNITASSTGTWTANFNVPVSAGGDHNISAAGTTTKAASIQNQTFTTLPSVSLDTTNASTGSTITATGSGFTPGQKSITVTFDDQELTSGISADTSGSWKATFAVPSAASGSHTIKIAGAGGVDLSVGDLSFKIKPAVALSPATGTVGSTVTVKGSGFAAGGNINITYDDNSVAKISADGSGSFSKSIVIPKSLAGDHEIKASDPTNFAATNFTIDSTAPPVPKPATPADGQTIGFMGSITPTFTWAKVTASSAVTYTFQVDSDPEFANPLEKGGLTINKYTLTNSEALPRGDYYWRVRAVDTASNQSPWSQPQYLKSGLISPILFTLILILVLAGLAFGVYYLMTKILPRRRAAQMASSPELVIPEIVNAEFKQIEGGKTALPWRLALPPAPQQPKGSKTLSSEDQARLKVIIDFAKALPLPQPDSNIGWLVEMAENVTGNTASPALYNQMLKGEIQVRYEPAWMRHPTFLDLQSLLEGQSIMQDLTTFVDTINNLASSADQVLQDIYRDTTAEVTWDLISNGGWAYISGVYTDGVGWFQGKNLREPSDRDYSVKAESAAGEEPVIIGLYGDQNTAFAGLLVKAHGETEVQQLRALHLKLRRSYRGSDKLKDLVNLITQLDVQRTRLLNAFSQFNRLST